MLKVLVTGGASFIVSNLVEELLKCGHSVRVIDNSSTGRRWAEPGSAPPQPGDVKHSLASVDVLTKKLGVRNLIAFPEGLARLTDRDASMCS